MAVLRIAMFGGRIPRLAARLLPDTAAQQAMNTRLTSGALRPWWKPKLLETLTLPRPKSVYRYFHNGERKILAFSRYTQAFESALINDAFDRIYYSDDKGFWITTKDDIENSVPPQKVGIPAPEGEFAVETVGGTEDTVETRVYVVTAVSKYGEESAPSAPVSATGAADGAWTISGLQALDLHLTEYPNIELLRVYRTITSGSGVDYRTVTEFDVSTLEDTFNDEVDATDLAAAPVLASLAWAPPPSGLRGVIPLPGGFNAGFVGKTVYFSEPYFPHSFPPDYQLAVDDEIVALGYFGNTLVIATKGKLAAAVGTTPAAMSLMTEGKIVPCLSAQSLVSTVGAVLFASEEGLVSISASGVQVITQAFLTRDEWMRLTPENIKGAIYEDRYLGFYSDSMGFAFQFDDPTTAWTDVQHPGVTAVVTDATTSRTLLLVGQKVVEWEGDTDEPMIYSWRSRPMQLPKPQNFGALQVRGEFFTVPAELPTTLPPIEDTLDDPLGFNVDGVNEGEPVDGPSASPFSSEEFGAVRVTIYGNRQLRWQGLVTSEVPLRLPSGFKDDEIEIEVAGTIPVFSVALASTMKALETTP